MQSYNDIIFKQKRHLDIMDMSLSCNMLAAKCNLEYSKIWKSILSIASYGQHLWYDELNELIYRKISNIRRTAIGNKIVDHSDVVGASPVGAAPTTSSFSTWHLASRDSAKTAARQYDKYSLLMHCIKIKSPVKFLLNEQYVFVGGNISFLCVLSCSSEEA